MIERYSIDDAPKDGSTVIAVIPSPSGKGEIFARVVWRRNRWCVLGDEEATPVITEYVVVR
jgi:hypothetical protein